MFPVYVNTIVTQYKDYQVYGNLCGVLVYYCTHKNYGAFTECQSNGFVQNIRHYI